MQYVTIAANCLKWEIQIPINHSKNTEFQKSFMQNLSKNTYRERRFSHNDVKPNLT